MNKSLDNKTKKREDEKPQKNQKITFLQNSKLEKLAGKTEEVISNT
jgi:hypothetical protein